jgi:hypothetical protein
MSENRTARNEAWIASLVLHVALLAGVVAAVGRPRDGAAGPVVINTRSAGHEIGVVLLDRPAGKPAPPPIVVRVRPEAPPVQPVVVPTPPVSVRQAGHQEIAPARPVETAPVSAVPPVTDVPGSPIPAIPPGTAVPGSPAPVTDVPGSQLPAGAATAFFGVPAIGKSIVFVLDRSASMGLDGRLDRARRELADSLRRLPPSAQFQVIAYNTVAEPIRIRGTVGLLPATPTMVDAVIAAVNRLPAEGGSEHLRALTEAVKSGPDVVYFLTDEDDLELRDVRTVTRINHGRVCIHALCLVPPAGGESPMQVLARSNRGQFAVVGK